MAFQRAPTKPQISKRGPPEEVQLDELLIRGLELQSQGLELQIASIQAEINQLSESQGILMLKRQVVFKDLLLAGSLDISSEAETPSPDFLKQKVTDLERKITKTARQLAALRAEFTELRKQKLHIDRRVNAEKGLS